MNLQSIPIARIVADLELQPRVALDEDTVLQYVDSLDELPPAVVYQEGKVYWLSAGFHRHEAHLRASRAHMICDVRRGTRRDALLNGIADNARHGLRYSNADKRRVVGLLLEDDEWKNWSDLQIAKQAGVSQPFVSKMRRGENYNGYNSGQSQEELDAAAIEEEIADLPEIVKDEARKELTDLCRKERAKEARRGRTISLFLPDAVIDIIDTHGGDRAGTVERAVRKMGPAA